MPPANEVCESYVFTHVCQSFCSRGGLPHCMLGHTTPSHPPDQRQVPTHPRTRGRYPPSRPEAVTPPPPSAVHAGRYGQQAGGTHPTGMKSCLNKIRHYSQQFSVHITVHSTRTMMGDKSDGISKLKRFWRKLCAFYFTVLLLLVIIKQRSVLECRVTMFYILSHFIIN